MPFNVTPKLKIASGLRQKSRFFFRKTEIRLRKPPSKPGQQRLRSEFRHVQHILSVQIILRIAGGGDILRNRTFRRISQRDQIDQTFRIGEIDQCGNFVGHERSEPAAADAAFPGGEFDALDRRAGSGIQMRRRFFRGGDRQKCRGGSFARVQSPSAVILEPRKIKSDTVSTVSPSISHEVMGPDATILVF